MSSRPARAEILWEYADPTGRSLVMKPGETVDVLDQSNTEWWYLRTQGGMEGFYPSNYMKITQPAERFSFKIASTANPKILELQAKVFAEPAPRKPESSEPSPAETAPVATGGAKSNAELLKEKLQSRRSQQNVSQAQPAAAAATVAPPTPTVTPAAQTAIEIPSQPSASRLTHPNLSRPQARHTRPLLSSDAKETPEGRGLVSLHAELEKKEMQLAERERQLQNLEAENAALKGRVQEQAMQISKFLNSTSGPGSDDELDALESASPSKACVRLAI